MSAIAGSVSLSAAKARGLGFKQSAPMGSRVAAAVPAQPRARTERGALKVVAGNDYEGGLFAPIVVVARNICLLYTSPSPRDQRGSRMPSSA